MKNLLFAVALLTALSATAQKNKREEGFKFGLKGGLNVSNVMSTDIEDNAIRTSIHIGAATEFVISDKFSIQPELLFSGQGYSDQTPGNYSRLKLNYINLPVLAKYYVAERLSVEIGPQLGVLVSGKERTNDSNDSVSNLSTIDFGLNAGLGYEFTSGVFFQGRYNLGLNNINTSSDADAKKFTNSVFSLSVGMFF
jgi:hypothetical protein